MTDEADYTSRLAGLAIESSTPHNLPQLNTSYGNLPQPGDQYQSFAAHSTYSPYQQQSPMFHQRAYMPPTSQMPPYGYSPQAYYEPQRSEFSVETMHGMPGYPGRPPVPRSTHTSPLNPSPPYPHHSPSQPYSRPSTAQTQAYGMWASPPMSPVITPMQYGGMRVVGMPSHSHVGPEFGGERELYYGVPSSWTPPSVPYGFYSPYQQQAPKSEARTRECWPGASPNLAQGSRNSWTGPPRPLPQGNPLSWSGPSHPPFHVRAESPEKEKEKERKAYHPQPPARRSDWVMWVGNVPNNTSHEELWRYFNSTVPSSDPTVEIEHWRGPSSIFLISRSSCAFVNLSSQVDLERAVGFFNGRPLRPWDSHCPRMVCRIRRKDDDLRAGVGAQRGTGMHRDWIKTQNIEPVAPPISGDSTGSIPASPAILDHPPDGDGRRRESVQGHDTLHKTSASYASTNSSFLTNHFPKRFFILKSLTTAELEDSAKSDTWKTQRHNEPVLDQAFRTSTEGVFLIFGANRSGEFFGYAKMVEPIDKERAVAHSASVSTRESSSGSSGPSRHKSQSQPSRIKEEDEDDRGRSESDPIRPTYFLSPSHSYLASSSPGELTPTDEPRTTDSRGERKTDPLRRRIDPKRVAAIAPRAQTLDPNAGQPGYFPPVRITAMSSKLEADNQQILGGSSRRQEFGDDGVLRKDTALTPDEKKERAHEHRDEIHDFGPDGWGQSFKIQWIKTGSLPFGRTRHLRNPWNADREVKVSRDGTEVEPNIGVRLLAEWDKLDRTFDPTVQPIDPPIQHRYPAVYESPTFLNR